MLSGKRVTGMLFLIGVSAMIVSAASACGGEGDEGPPPALETVSPDTETPWNPKSPAPEPEAGAEETLTIAQSTQGSAVGLRLGVLSTKGGKARISVVVESGPAKDSEEYVEGEAGTSTTLDSGHTVAINEVTPADPDAEDEGNQGTGAGTGSVTVTLTAP